jgi:MFS family permease
MDAASRTHCFHHYLGNLWRCPGHDDPVSDDGPSNHVECELATLTQVIVSRIVFRALQGMGGAGCFSISMVVFFELIPKDKYPKYGSILSADVALATLLGPIIGGAIADQTTWRWVFLLK